jgi:phage terminase small subunit
MFVEHYLLNLNAHQAALAAGFSKMYSAKRAFKIVRRPQVVAAIEAAQAERVERMKISADKVVLELAKVAFLDLSSVIRVEGGRVIITDASKLTPEIKSALSEIAQTDSGIRIKAHDKMKALELIGRHLGMFTDKLEHSGKVKLTTDELTDEELERIAALGRPGTTPPAPGPEAPA